MSNVKTNTEILKQHDEIVKLGGLYIIGTERHESRRIDNQLRGRSGRQGDPGESKFFVSLEDDLMRIFGGEQISRLMTAFNFPEDQALTHPIVSKAIEQAQVKVEGFNFDIRKHLVEYDDVLNKQREIIYSLRKKILLPEKKDQFRQTVIDILHEEINSLVGRYFFDETAFNQEEIIKRFVSEVNSIVVIPQNKVDHLLKERNNNQLINFLKHKIEDEFNQREKKLTAEVWQGIVRFIFISTIDNFWTEHLTAIEDLREGINLRGYAQLDPLVEYKNEAFSMFEKLVSDINFEVTRRLFKVEIAQREPAKEQPIIYKSASAIDPFHQRQAAVDRSQGEQPIQQTATNPSNIDGFKIIPPGAKHRKLGRNDPCWCGSGKKYKK